MKFFHPAKLSPKRKLFPRWSIFHEELPVQYPKIGKLIGKTGVAWQTAKTCRALQLLDACILIFKLSSCESYSNFTFLKNEMKPETSGQKTDNLEQLFFPKGKYPVGRGGAHFCVIRN